MEYTKILENSIDNINDELIKCINNYLEINQNEQDFKNNNFTSIDIGNPKKGCLNMQYITVKLNELKSDIESPSYVTRNYIIEYIILEINKLSNYRKKKISFPFLDQLKKINDKSLLNDLITFFTNVPNDDDIKKTMKSYKIKDDDLKTLKKQSNYSNTLLKTEDDTHNVSEFLGFSTPRYVNAFETIPQFAGRTKKLIKVQEEENKGQNKLMKTICKHVDTNIGALPSPLDFLENQEQETKKEMVVKLEKDNKQREKERMKPIKIIDTQLGIIIKKSGTISDDIGKIETSSDEHAYAKPQTNVLENSYEKNKQLGTSCVEINPSPNEQILEELKFKLQKQELEQKIELQALEFNVKKQQLNITMQLDKQAFEQKIKLQELIFNKEKQKYKIEVQNDETSEVKMKTKTKMNKSFANLYEEKIICDDELASQQIGNVLLPRFKEILTSHEKQHNDINEKKKCEKQSIEKESIEKQSIEQIDNFEIL
jgi:hypothetical protein